eukprot:s2777_g7.t1
MASIGLVGQHFLKFPGFENSPAGFSIMGRGEGVLGFFAIFLISGVLELAWENEGAQQRTHGDDLCARYFRGRMCNWQRCDSAVRLLSYLTLFSSIYCTVLHHLRDSLCEFRPCRTACRP